MDQININDLYRLKNNSTDKASENLLSSIINQAPDIIYVADLEKRAIIFINTRVNDMLGLSEEEIYQKGFDFFPDHVHPDDYLKRMDQMSQVAVINQDEPIEIEVRMIAKDDTYYRWFRISERIFSRDENCNPQKLIGIITDIHQQKLAEEETKKLNRELIKKNRELQSLNRELESINHIAGSEFTDYLQNMYTSLEYVAVKDAERFSNTGKANIRKAQAHIQKMRLIIKDLTAFLRLKNVFSKNESVDLNKVINEVIQYLPSNEHRYSISSSRLPWVKGNYVLLTMLFKNLFENSVKFQEENMIPAVKINYSKADELNFHPQAIPDTSYNIISVKDNGIGFEKNESEKIFTIFYRANGNKYHGAGMGLAVCKRIMELHGGFMDADGQPGMGAQFVCYFPIEQF